VAEIKFNNFSANASQLSEKLAKRTEELKAIQKQNILLNNQLAEARSQLVEVQAENKENYWAKETEKNTREILFKS